MEAHEYQTLFDVETTYWWFRALRGILLDTCRRLGLDASSRMLDAGCGTGKFVEVLRETVSPLTIGLDYSPSAVSYWKQRGLGSMCVASANAVPFREAAFDAVFAIDLFECNAVDEHRAYRELWRVLRPGGYLVMLVPAYDWLTNPEHDRAVRASRRYTRRRLRRMLGCAPVRIVRTTHLFLSLLGPIAIYRCWHRWGRRQENGQPRSDLRALPGLLNACLFRAVDWERHLLPMVNLPVGSSILAVVQKTASPGAR